MRSIGELDMEEQATTFCGYLSHKGIRAQKEEEGAGGPWSIWVEDEEQVADAMGELLEFQSAPTASKYEDLALEALQEEKKRLKEEKKGRWRDENPMERWRNSAGRTGTVTLAFVLACAATFLVTGMGENKSATGSFYISEVVGPFLPEVRNWQVWRLVTPIFLHMGFFHFLFNMYWLHELGRMIESRRGTLFLVLFILLVAVISNLVQYFFSGPGFGGMSGVNYGLFGYIWMKGKFDPGDGLELNPTTITILLAWFVICFTGVFGNIANGAHAGGLAMGAAWGYLSALHWTRTRG